MIELKAFNKWSTTGIEVKDPGLKGYISLEPRIVPKTGARYAKQRFHKSKTFIVERLINKLMVPGHKGKKHFKTSYRSTGKAHTAYDLVEETLKIVETRTKKNPIEVLVRAIENGAPREEIITIEYGGARYPKAVECGPQRRIDLAMKNMVQGAYQRSFGKKKAAAQALAEEIIESYESLSTSQAIAKKRELERQADASR